MNKKWFISTVILLLAVFLFIAGFVIFIDPLMFYHKPLFKYGYTITDDAYQNAGIAKNFDYSSVLVGSSMSQNFQTKQFDELFDTETVKICFHGAYAKTIKRGLDVAFAHKDIENVFWGLDTYAFTVESDFEKHMLPTYLYDKNPLNDVNYLFNKTLLFSSFKTLYKIITETPNDTISEAFNWHYRALETGAYNASIVHDISLDSNEPESVEADDFYLKTTMDNLNDNILPFVKENPDTSFYFMFTTPSIVYWQSKYINGTFEATLKAQEYAVRELLKYPNVEIIYLCNDENNICDLMNYFDNTHYDMKINTQIASCTAEGKNYLDESNYIEEIDKLRKLVVEYDYQELYSKYAQLN